MDPTSADAADRAARELFADWLDSTQLHDEAALGGLCAEHPEFAERFRTWHRQLEAIGELGALDASSIDGIDDRGPLDDATDERPGGRIGPYLLEHELGRGAQAIVWAAIDTRDDRAVALKVLPPQVAGSRQRLQRFRREAELARRVRHPALCEVFEAGSAGDTLFLAMRRVEGHTLAESIAARRASRDHAGTVSELVETFARLADGLHAAHEQGLLHRDIKPGNVMLDAAGDPVLLDFGLARESLDDDLALTMTGDLLGTPAYMSPEQIAAQRIPLDRRSDVWSLGATLFEALTLRRPFDAPTMDRLLQQILTTDPPRIDRLDRRLPRDLAIVVATCLEKDRARRYATAADLAEDLRRVGRRQAIRARPVGPLRRLTRWTARHPLAAGLVATLLIGSGAVTAFAIQAATANARYDLISTLPALDRARAAVPSLFPAWPERIPELQAWSSRHGEPLIQRLEAVETALAALGAQPADDAGQGLRITLLELRDALLSFRDDPAVDGAATVREALDWAGSIARRSIEEHRDAWDAARRDLADDPRFQPLDLQPQLGLVPRGRNPHTGLQEFVHLASHAPDAPLPERDPDTGYLPVDAGTGIVFVLVPGEPQATAAPPQASAIPIRFMAAHELTKAQWLRLSRSDDVGWFDVDALHDGERTTWLHPLEHHGVDELRRVLRRHALRLPSDAEWEHAARAGVDGPFVCDREDLPAFANLSGTDDGFAGPAPVGRLRPNGFGLFDVQGNVLEWCGTPRTEDAFASADGEAFHSVLGGSYLAEVAEAAFPFRPAVPASTRDEQIGVRAVRDLTLLPPRR